MLKVVSVAGLSAVCAFKPKEIQVQDVLYGQVPSDKMEDFEVVLNKTKDLYEDKVKEVKSRGEKPKALALKSEAIQAVLNPWLERMNLLYKSVHVKHIESKNPRIPKVDERLSVAPVKLNKEEIAQFYDDFPSDVLPDSSDEESDSLEKSDSIDSLFEGEEDMFGPGVQVVESKPDVGKKLSVDLPEVKGVNFEDLF